MVDYGDAVRRWLLVIALASACKKRGYSFEDLSAACTRDGGKVEKECTTLPGVKYVPKDGQSAFVTFERDELSCSYKCTIPLERP